MDELPACESFGDERVGYPVAELHPLPQRTLDASELLESWRHLPSIDPVRLRCDIDDVIDPAL